MGLNMAEKRQFQRVDSHLPVRYKKVNELVLTSKGTITQNIGTGGIAFRVAYFIPVLTRVGLEISLPSLSKPIMTTAEVVWLQKRPYSIGYEIGTRFIEVTKEDRTHLAEFVRHNT